MMTEARAFAPGKLILTGEHAVVYGHRAVALAVNLGTTVSLQKRLGPSGIDSSDIQDARLWPALSTILPEEGIGVHITSTLPIGCGMGSSAALAVATVRAYARLKGEEADFNRCYTEAFKVERVFHGNPSGLDHSVSALGGVLVYRRSPTGPHISPLAPVALHLVVVDTGPPAQSTAEMVENVRIQGNHKVLSAIGKLSEEIIKGLNSPERLGPLLNQNHRLLCELGVSTPTLNKAVSTLRRAGALGAKLAGAGGGGVAIGLVRPGSRVAERMQAEGWKAMDIEVYKEYYDG